MTSAISASVAKRADHARGAALAASNDRRPSASPPYAPGVSHASARSGPNWTALASVLDNSAATNSASSSFTRGALGRMVEANARPTARIAAATTNASANTNSATSNESANSVTANTASSIGNMPPSAVTSAPSASRTSPLPNNIGSG